MKLYLISQDQNNYYDTYDSAVVAAPDEDTARRMDPDGKIALWEKHCSAWCSSSEYVQVRYLGEAAEGTEQGVICASFNAG